MTAFQDDSKSATTSTNGGKSQRFCWKTYMGTPKYLKGKMNKLAWLMQLHQLDELFSALNRRELAFGYVGADSRCFSKSLQHSPNTTHILF
jgi:hypothetical protein